MSNITPGPWKLINGSVMGLIIRGANDRIVLSESKGLGNKDEAALIAAAPAMYEALKAARYVIDGTTPVGKMIEAALSEANGTQK